MASIKVELLGDATSLERAFSRAARSSGQLKVGLGGIIKTAAAITGITLGVRGLSNVLTDSVKSAASFEQSMQRFVGLAGGAQSAVGGLSDKLLDLAPQVGKGPQELADALYFVASAGIAADKQLGVVVSSAKASAAGLGDTATVADAVTSAMNAYGSAVLGAQKATDILVATVREGKGEANAFAPVIGNVAALAAKLGVSFNDVGAALAAQTQLGTNAETASIQLQAFFSALIKTSPQAEKALNQVGLTSQGLIDDLGSKGLLNVLGQVNKAIGANPKALGAAFPNIRALRGLLSLVGKNGEQVIGVFNRLNKSAGSTEFAFAAISKTTQQQFNKTAAAISSAEVRIGAAFAPLAEDLANDITKIANRLSHWLENTQNQERVQKTLNEIMRDAKAAFDAFLDVARPTADVVQKLTDKVGGLKNAVKLLLTVMVVSKVVNYATALTGIGTQAAGSAKKVNLLRLALLRLSAIGLIVVGIELVTHRDQIEKWSSGVQRGLESWLKSHKMEAVSDALFGAGDLSDLPTTVKSLPLLEKYRKQLIKVAGAEDIRVKALDKVIERLQKIQQLQERGDRGKGSRGAGQRGPLPGEIPNFPSPKRGGGGGGVGGSGGGGGGGAGGTTFSDRLQSLFADFDLALSKAELTPILKDDLAVLQKQLAVVRGLLKTHKNDLDLKQKEVELQGSILALQTQQADALKEQRKAQAQLLADAKDSAASLFGTFFQQAETSANKALFLGGSRGTKLIQRPGADAKDLLATVKAQNAAFATLTTDIAKLAKQGAPSSLVTAARSGQITPEQVAAIANADRATRDRIFKQIRRADKLITQAAKAEINTKNVAVRAQTVTVQGATSAFKAGGGPREGGFVVNGGVHLHGVQNPKEMEAALERRAKQRAGQRRGRTGGKR